MADPTSEYDVPRHESKICTLETEAEKSTDEPDNVASENESHNALKFMKYKTKGKKMIER